MSLLLALLSTASSLAADVTQSTTTALDAVAVPGAVAVSSASTQSTTTALGATATPGAVSATAGVASSSTTALDPVAVPGPVSLAGSVAASTTSALDAVAVPGAVSLSAAVTASTTTALGAIAVPGAVTLSAAVTQSTTQAFDAVAYRITVAPRGDRFSVALSLPVWRASLSLPARSLSLAIPRRQTTVALPARAISLALPRRISVADIQGFTQGDRCESTHTLTVTLGGSAQTIDQPLSLAARLYARGSTTLTTSVAITVADCTGWGTTSVVAPVVYDSATSASLPAGTYNVEIVATYADGTVRWPENGSATQIVVRAPGAT